MEFIKELPCSGMEIERLKNLLVIDSLTTLCESIHSVTSRSEHQADIYCLWGAFDLQRQELKCGVRFSLIDCPHAFAWTVTINKATQSIVIHCTMDKSEHDPDFIDSIYEFITDWEKGLLKVIA